MTPQAAERLQAAKTPAAAKPVRPPSYRPNFVAQMTSGAVALGAEIRWLSSDYIAAMRRGQQTAMIVGYHFPLNNAAAALLADDKSATAEVLACCDVPHVRHTLIRFDSGDPGSDDGLADEIDRVAGRFGFPLVIKPNRGTGGEGVTRLDSEAAMFAALTCLRVQYQALAASPWVDITGEYRVVVLDDQALLIFEKVRAVPGDEWRSNLKYGSMPVIQAGHRHCDPLTAMALRATGALGLRFASVDVVVSGTDMSVLEVNSGVCLERFSVFSADHFDRAAAVYARAVRACIAAD